MIVATVGLGAIATGNDTQVAETFRSETTYVELPVLVTDNDGHFVSDLSKVDFHVFEDGRAQTISTFYTVGTSREQPLVGPGASSEPAHQEIAQTVGAIYLFIFDDYHITPSETLTCQKILKEFINTRLKDPDLSAIAIASGGGQDLTADRQRLLSTVEDLHGRLAGGQSLAEREIQASILLKVLLNVSEAAFQIQARRKALILISSDLGCEAAPGGLVYCGDELRRTIGAAQRANVSIYPLYPFGLFNPGYITAERPSRPSMPASSNRRQGTFSGLRSLAVDTGGFMITDTNNLSKAFDRLETENRSYYLIGYYSTNENSEGKFRRNKVTVNRKHLKIIYRPGYFSAKLDKER